MSAAEKLLNAQTIGVFGGLRYLTRCAREPTSAPLAMHFQDIMANVAPLSDVPVSSLPTMF